MLKQKLAVAAGIVGLGALAHGTPVTGSAKSQSGTCG